MHIFSALPHSFAMNNLLHYAVQRQLDFELLPVNNKTPQKG